MYVANTDWALYNFRKGLIKELLSRGYEISVVCQAGHYLDKLKDLNVKKVCVLKHYQKDINAIKDLKLIKELHYFYKANRPYIVHHFTIKPVVFGSIAARIAGVPIIVNTITGMGYVFTNEDKRNFLLRLIVLLLYKLAARFTNFFFFQNRSDRDFFLCKGLASTGKNAIVPGSGINASVFSPDNVNQEVVRKLRRELQINEDQKIVLLVSRMLYDKGIEELVRCACEIRKTMPSVRFLLVGPLAPGNPSRITKDTLKQWVKRDRIEYLGKRHEIRELLFLSDIVVLPSYREGMPKSLLEAAAMSRAIVTTDAVGCRDVVNHGENGLLIPIKDSRALGDAILRLLNDDKLRHKMGLKSRQRTLEEFDEQIIINKTVEVYERLLSPQ
ncbi:MAG: glycosyltransferase family 4 protein [Deltaproteobacteria bacterium]|nr:glycosyltransferase family 4 protein [Deltaproteobacteria bacterium]